MTRTHFATRKAFEIPPPHYFGKRKTVSGLLPKVKRTIKRPFPLASVISTASLLTFQTGWGQTPLTIQQEERGIVLEWPGGEPLLSSRDLTSWEVVPDATSPFAPALEGSEATFFAIEFQPAALDFPGAGVTVGSEEVRLQGTIGSAFRRSAGLTVTINGQPAEIVENESGPDLFRLSNLALPAGSNSVSVLIRNAAGATESFQTSVTVDPIVANNVVLTGNYAYAAMGADGLAILELSTGRRIEIPAELNSLDVNDLAVADGFLFVLDTVGTSGGGRFRSLSLANPEAPTFSSNFATTPTRFFSGISAANGRVAVSGGTEPFRIFEYDQVTGAIGGEAVSGFGVLGRPDVILTPDGATAFISVDFNGTFQGFNLGLVAINISDRASGPRFGFSEAFRLGLSDSSIGRSSQPANFRLESALLGDTILVAHEEGLSVVQEGARTELLNLGFRAINVDVVGQTAFVVGTESNETVARIATIDFSNVDEPRVLENRRLPGRGPFLGVAANDDFVVIATNDEAGLMVIERE